MKTRLQLPCQPDAADLFLSEPPDAVVSAIRRMNGNFLVLGAAGKMGLHVCMMLRRAMDAGGGSATVTAVSRFGKPGTREEFESHGIKTRSCDLSEPAQLASLEEAPNVIFMAGAKFGTAGRPDLLQKMNVEMPGLVAERFSGSTITVYSTGCVYSYQQVSSRGSTELAPTDPPGEYAKSCLGREQAFRKVAAETVTRVGLIRLNYSVEFRYGVLVDLLCKIRAGEAIDLSMGYVNLIWQRDAVAQSILAHELASTAPFIINITGPDVLRVRDLATALGHLAGREPIFTGTEEQTAWLSDATLSHRLFGPPETPLQQMLEWIAAWQEAGLPLLNKPTGFEKRDGNF